MKTIKERVENELKELETRLNKLYKFIEEDERFHDLGAEAQRLLRLQCSIMGDYRNVLLTRIKLLEDADE